MSRYDPVFTCVGCEDEEQARHQAAAHCGAPAGRDRGEAGGGGGARHREHLQHAHHHQAPQHAISRVSHEVGDNWILEIGRVTKP